MMLELFKKITLIYGSLAVALVVPIVVLPYYLGYMGIELWGRYCLILLVQSILSVLEAGLSQGITREFSKANVGLSGFGKSVVFFKILQNLYFAIFLSFSVVFCFVAHWFFPEKFFWEEIFSVVVIFGSSFLGGLYKSFVNSLQKAHVSYLVSALSVIGKAGVGFFVLRSGFGFNGFLFSQVFVFVCEALFRHVWILRIISEAKVIERPLLNNESIRKNIFDSIRISSVVIFGVLVSQIDKFFAGYYLSLSDFGVYSICLTVLYGMLQLLGPLGQFYLPKIISDNAVGRAESKKIYLYFMLILGASLMLVGLGFGEKLLRIWLKDSLLASQVYAVLHPIFFGVFVYSIAEYFYTLLVARGDVKRIFIRNLSSFSVSLMVSPFFFSMFGMVGGGYFWLCLTFLYLITSIGSKSGKGVV